MEIAQAAETAAKEQTAARQRGVVRWFSDKGYGFIDSASGDIFVHHTAIVMDGFRKLFEGQEVEFEIENSPKGLRAVKVKPLD